MPSTSDSSQTPGAELSPVKRALSALAALEAKLAAMEQERREPVAIVGMACRFPGGADSPEAFWEILRAGADVIQEVPPDRWDAARYYDPNPDAPGKINSRYGGFVGPPQEFDADFFGVTPREAVSLDPQQRLLLEVAWEALESSGFTVEALDGSATGVFVGIGGTDYVNLLTARAPESIDGYLGSGNAHSSASGRISYRLGLGGPSLSVDTACSSSLVAMHLACQSLRLRECDAALAGGVSRILNPAFSISFARARMLAADGRCKVFDAAADGYVRSEGCGVVVLKRLSDALAARDTILATILGSAVNQDGRSSGLTVPNGPAQQEVIWSALRSAGIQPHQVDYVEAHGTGTSLGDPIEVNALGAVFSGRGDRPPLYIGSAKANLGHLEAAAGMAGVIKTVLVLGRGEIPPQPNYRTPNPRVPWPDLPLRVPEEIRPWPRQEGRRLAGVSAFGFSGTNAHLVLEGPPASPAPQPSASPWLLTLSANSEAALHLLAQSYAGFLAAHPDADMADFCYSANSGRSRRNYRAALVAGGSREFQESLLSCKSGGSGGAKPKVAFLFTGQGSQYTGMGLDLHRREPIFREALDRCACLAAPFLSRGLLEILNSRDGSLDQTGNTQPVLFALEYALAALWRSWGLTPAALLGHSVGEYAAACLAGVFSLEDGIRLIARRAALMNALPKGGSMLAVWAGEERVVRELRAAAALPLAIAAVNGPESVTVSGPIAALEEFARRMEAQGVAVKDLRVSHAFHSPLMDPMLDALAGAAREIAYRPPQLPLVSNLSGTQAGGEITSARYWVEQTRQPVRFAAGVQALWELGCRIFVEIGPQPTLLAMSRQMLPREGTTWIASLRPGRDSLPQMLEGLAALYCQGADMDCAALPPQKRNRLQIPTYPFERHRHWYTPLEEKAEVDGSPIDQLFYGLRWEPLDQETGTGRPLGSWILVGDRGGVAERLSRRLQAAGDHCTILAVEQASNLAGHVMHHRLLHGVVHLASLDFPADEAMTAATLETAQQIGAAAVLSSLGELAKLDRATPPRLWLVTCAAVPAMPGERLALAQSPLWGLGRVIALEHPRLWGGLIDLDSNCTDPAEAIAAGLARAPGDQLAWRGGALLAPQLVRTVAPSAQTGRVSGTVLLTGGLGGIGLQIAGRLAASGVPRVVLVGRRAPDPELRRWLEGLGPSVVVRQADVCREADLRAVLDEIAASGPPLCGVLHAAGISDDGLLAGLTSERFGQACAAKVTGGFLLHRLTRALPLDFFVLFSAGAAILGAPGQGSYAAGNHFLDALAHHRQALGLPGLSINWGAWGSSGMFANGGGRFAARMAAHGMELMPTAQALMALERMLFDPRPQCAILSVDWVRFVQQRDGGNPPFLLRRLVPQPLEAKDGRPAAAQPRDIVKLLRAAAPAERQGMVERHLQRLIALTIGGDGTAAFDPRRGFSDMGIDSLLALELRGRIEAEFGCSLPSTIVFERPSVHELAARLLEELPPAVAAPANCAAPPGAANGIAELSENEVEELLLQKLRSLSYGLELK